MQERGKLPLFGIHLTPFLDEAKDTEGHSLTFMNFGKAWAATWGFLRVGREQRNYSNTNHQKKSIFRYRPIHSLLSLIILQYEDYSKQSACLTVSKHCSE